MKEHRLIHLTAAEKRALARVAGLQASGATLNTAGQAALAKAYTTGSMTATSTDPTKIDAMVVTGAPSSQLRVNSRRAEEIAGSPNIDPDTLQPTYDPNSQAGQHQAAVADNQAAGTIQTRQASDTGVIGAPTAGAMGQTGAVGYNPTVENGQKGITGSGETGLASTTAAINKNEKDALAYVNANPGSGYGGNIEDQKKAIKESAESDRQNAIAMDTAQKSDQKATQERANASAAATAASGALESKAKKKSTPANDSSPDTTKRDGIATALDGIISASGDPMGPVYKEMILQDWQNMEDSKASAGANLDASVNRAEDQNNDVTALIDKYTKLHQENNDKYTALLDETRDSQQKYLEEQKQRDIDRLTWEANKETQKLTRQKTQQLLSQSIQNALSGGAFSGAANEQLASTEREWDKSISDLATEYSFKKADVSAFYTQKYVDTNNQFNLDIFNAAKELDSKLEGYAIQGFNSIQAMENAKTTASNDYRTAIDLAKKTYSDNVKGYVKEIQTSINSSRDDARAQEQLGWTRLEKAIDDYRNGIPQSLLTSIGKMLPGVDLTDVVKARTLAQLKKGAGTGSGVGTDWSFPSGMMKSTGDLPSFDDYIKAKENELGMSISPEAREKYRKEYAVRSKATTDLNPTEIARRFARKAATLSGPTRTYSQALFDRAMAEKDYEYASRIADDTGDDVDATSSTAFVKALTTRQSVNQLAQMVEEFGTMGPVTGRLRNIDPYDDKAVRFKQIITETVPGLARGIFYEVGVLTDTDIKTYTSVVGNPNLTIAQARQAFIDLKSIIDRNMKAQIDVWDANRKTVGGFKEIYNQKPLNVQDAVGQSSFLDTLPLAQ